MSNVIAIYCRLSLEDGDVAESESISNQRDLIKNYISNNDDFTCSKTVEYVDDGYTGLNFERPSAKKMLDEVKEGKINTIIVKDFSRFGRNDIEVGDYIEQIFPFLNIRFIAINDNFDSHKLQNTTGNMNFVFSSFMNYYYIKDVSSKVQTANRIKMKKGEYLTGKAPFGYIKSDIEKNKLVIDEYSASIVKKIFDLFIKGYSINDVARQLNKENIPTPSIYMNNKIKADFWSKTAVSDILKNEVYIGTFIGGRTKSKIVGNKFVSKQMPTDTWIIIENNHDAIVDKETFVFANEMRIKKPKINKPKANDYLLKGKIVCEKCGHKLYKSKSKYNAYFFCYYATVNGGTCFCGKVYENKLLDILESAIKLELSLINSEKEKALNINKQSEEKITILNDKLKKLDKTLSANKNYVIKLYEQYKNDDINKDNFISIRQKKADETKAIETEKEFANNEILKLKEEIQKNEKFEVISTANETNILTKELVNQMVDCIKIYNDMQIEIVWKHRGNILYTM